MPDPVAVIDTDGLIKFCSVQLGRVLRCNVDGLIGSSIEEIIVPESRSALRRLIQDLLNTENRVRAMKDREEDVSNGTASDENGHNLSGSGTASNDVNAVSKASGQSFPMLEVNVDDEDKATSGENASDSLDEPIKTKCHKTSANKYSSVFTQKSSSLTSETSRSEDNEEPRSKKSKTNGKEVQVGSLQLHSRNAIKHDDVMGASVTANNADAKLSSLMHYPTSLPKDREPSLRRKLVLAPHSNARMGEKQDDSRSSSDNDSDAREGVNNSSEASGYRNSNESSDQDSSSISGTSIASKKNGKSSLL